MQKLFLASLFKDVSQIFVEFANEKLAGKRGLFQLLHYQANWIFM